MENQKAPTTAHRTPHHPTQPMILPNPIENPRAKEPNPYPAPHPPQPAKRTPTLLSLTQPRRHQLNTPSTDSIRRLPTQHAIYRLNTPSNRLNTPSTDSTRRLPTQHAVYRFNTASTVERELTRWTRADAFDESRRVGREQTRWTRADALDEIRRVGREQTRWTRADALDESRRVGREQTHWKMTV